jgi:hypothetical protein
MTCPLLSTKSEYNNKECIKKDCAWWDNANKVCAILSIVMELIKRNEK